MNGYAAMALTNIAVAVVIVGVAYYTHSCWSLIGLFFMCEHTVEEKKAK